MNSVSTNSFPTISTDELRAWLEAGKPVTVLDVRSSDERHEWAIPGSLHEDAYAALRAGDPRSLEHVNPPRDRAVVTVCAAGRTSLIAAEHLRQRGFEAYSLLGGMKAWSLAWNTADVPLDLDGTGFEGVEVVQVRRTGKGCLSYLIASEGEAVVIDASLEPEVYLEIARRRGWHITRVLETHVHADHLSRSRTITAMTGAQPLLPEQDRVHFPHSSLRDGDVIAFRKARMVAIHTPGHTLESTTYLLNDRALFTGDTLFLAGVGRPDLEANPEEARARAHLLYHSLRRLLELPDDVLVLPGHASSPIAFDGVPIIAPLGRVKPMLAMLEQGEDGFVRTILERIPPTPPNHHRIVELNEAETTFDGDPSELEAGANRCAVSATANPHR